MSQKVPLRSHVAKYGMYSKYKPAQEKSNNRQIVDLKLYRKRGINERGFVVVCQVSQEMERKRHAAKPKTVSNTSIWFQMLNLRGRSKAKKKSTAESQEERENMSPVMETEMDRLRRNTAEGRKSRDSGRSDEASPQKGGGEREGDARHQKGFSFLPGSGASAEEQEEETDIDEIPLSKREKSVRWTDVCEGEDVGGVKEEVKKEERIKQQLFSGVC